MPKNFQPYFVTKTERQEFQNIENKTFLKFYIMQEIRKMLDEMPDKEAAANRKKDRKEMSSIMNKHHELMSMFYNVK